MVSSDTLSAILERSHVEDPCTLAKRVVEEFNHLLSRLDDDHREIMRFICRGMMNKVIAKKLCISIRTVEVRRSKVFQVMEVSNAAELGLLVGAAESFQLMLKTKTATPAQWTIVAVPGAPSSTHPASAAASSSPLASVSHSACRSCA